MAAPLLGLLALVTAGIGAVGGLGGAILLVPLLVRLGEPASEAASLGLLSVAAGSVAAGSHQLKEATVNHRKDRWADVFRLAHVAPCTPTRRLSTSGSSVAGETNVYRYLVQDAGGV